MRRLLREIRNCPSPLLFLDYDGTLAPIRSDPAKVRIPPSRKDILMKLARRFPAAIVSGRSLKDLRAQVGLPGIAYAGNHGLEVRRGQTLWIHPEAKKAMPVLKKTLREAERRLKHIPGVCVDDKGLSASVHFRRAHVGDIPEIRRILRSLVPAAPGRLMMTRGKKVFEIRPAVDWDKGQSVLCLSNLIDPAGEATPVYIGDDRTDEDAFRALVGRGLTVHVGKSRRTAARYRLLDVDAVWRFLRALLLI